MFTPNSGEMIQFDEYFSDGLVQPPTRPCRRIFFAKLDIQEVGWNSDGWGIKKGSSNGDSNIQL